MKTHKTASTSAEMYLEPFCSPPDQKVDITTPVRITDYGIVGSRNIDFEELPYWEGHAGARKIRDGLPKDVWDSSLKITTSRNPFTRAVSKFFFRIGLGLLPSTQCKSEVAQAFRSFVHTDQFKSDFFRVHIKKQFAIDHVIRYECLSQDLENLAGQLGLDKDRTSLPHARDNRAARQSWSLDDLYDTAAAERVRQIDAWIFEHCGYSSDLKDAVL
ncbi:MAG: hypothetical protein ABJ246_17535 [Paracoccaceae bacterium]